MIFFLTKKLKLREIDELGDKINHLMKDNNRTSNTDSLSQLLHEQKRKTKELMDMIIAEEAALTRPNPEDRRIIGVPDQQAGNVHENEEYVI